VSLRERLGPRHVPFRFAVRHRTIVAWSTSVLVHSHDEEVRRDGHRRGTFIPQEGRSEEGGPEEGDSEGRGEEGRGEEGRAKGYEEEAGRQAPVGEELLAAKEDTGVTVAITHATGIKFAEAGFLLILIAGVWLVASEIAALGALKWHTFRIIVAGGCLAAAGVLLIVAVHWGGFG
jgi:hypothetical protein